MKLACVVQRYGPEVVGGSEFHCRALAERLAASHEVTVLTSCATDYVTWRNAYPSGATTVGPVRVRRFPVARQRSHHRLADLSALIEGGGGARADEEAWFRENGPDVPELLDHLRGHGHDYDLVLFWTFRYAPSFFGLPLVRDRAILIPTAEDDPIVRLRILSEYFRLPRGFMFLTPEEADLIAERAGAPLAPAAVIGIGLEPADEIANGAVLSRLGIPQPYSLYLGRVDPNKGCDTMFRHYERLVERDGAQAPLVLAGPVHMRLPDRPWIRSLGFVDDRSRAALLASSRMLVVPSPYESLCIALLEAWNHGCPAVVNGRCAVLKGQVVRANGGLYYHHAEEFIAAARELLTDPALARQLGQQGRAYVDEHYRWPTVMKKVETFLAGIRP